MSVVSTSCCLCTLPADVVCPLWYVDDCVPFMRHWWLPCMQVDPRFMDSDSDCETDVSQPLAKHHCDHDTLGQARQQAAFGKREREEPEPCSCPEEHVVSSKWHACSIVHLILTMHTHLPALQFALGSYAITMPKHVTTITYCCVFAEGEEAPATPQEAARPV